MVKNVTLTMDKDLLQLARKLAIDRNTSVNQMVREYLEKEVYLDDKHTAAIEQWKRLSGKGGLGAEGITWTREELHER